MGFGSQMIATWHDSTLPPIACASVATAGLLYPIDVLRALKMASASGPKITATAFIKSHGIMGLATQGVIPEICRATWMRILKFYCFPKCFKTMWQCEIKDGAWWQKAVAGAVAVIPEATTITSLELAKIGLQTDSENKFKNSTSVLLKELRARYGYAGLMIGWQGVLVRQVAWTSIYFSSIDFYKRNIQQANPSFSSAQVNLLGGFLAGVSGAIPNSPMDVVRTHIQREGLRNAMNGTLSKGNVLSYVASPVQFARGAQVILQERGVSGLYFGFGIKSLHMGASGALLAWLIPVFTKLINP